MENSHSGNGAVNGSTPPDSQSRRGGGRLQLWRAWIVLQKELREILRDRRTRFAVILGPLLLTPGLIILIGHAARQQAQRTQTETVSAAIVNASGAPALAAQLRTTGRLHLVPLTEQQADAAIRAHTLRAAALLPSEADRLEETGAPIPITILSDLGNQSSQTAAGRLRDAFDAAGGRITILRLRRAGISPALLTPFRIKDRAVAGGGSSAMLVLAMMLPYVLVISAFSGGLYAAIDQVAGEKERGTLEALLVSPASRLEIVLGKFGAIAAVCLLSALLSVVGLGLCFQPGVQGPWGGMGGSVHLSGTAVGLMLLMMAPMAILFSGILLAVSTFARNPKEAQSYIGPLYMVVLVPAMLTMFAGEAGRAAALVPIYGPAWIIRQVLSGVYDPIAIGLVLAGSVLYAALAVALAIWMFGREEILLKA